MGRLGIALGNTSSPVTVPVPVAATAGVLAWAMIAAGSQHTAAIPFPWDAYPPPAPPAPPRPPLPPSPPPPPPPPPPPRTAMFAFGTASRGGLGTCVARGFPHLYEQTTCLHTHGCAGDGSWGQLGIALGNTSTPVTVPVPVATTAGVSSGWASVSAGLQHTCAIADSTRAAYCWGAPDPRHGGGRGGWLGGFSQRGHDSMTGLSRTHTIMRRVRGQRPAGHRAG